MRPPLSSSQSPLSSVSACGENCACSLAPPLPTARGAAGAPFGLAKREMGRARSKEKSVWRAAVQWPSALTEVDVSVQAPILARLRARLGLLRFLGLPSRGGWCGGRRGGYRMELLLFSLPLAAPRGNWRSGPIKASAPTEIPSALRILWGPTCVSALARVTKATSPVGADALVRPPAQAATTAQAARSDCAAVGGSAVLRMRRAPCGQAERAEGGASGTLVTEIRGAPQRETGKEERFKCARVLQSKTHYAAGIRR